jgi:hypothetical protein
VGDENSREELEELLTLRAVRKEGPGESGCLLRDSCSQVVSEPEYLLLSEAETEIHHAAEKREAVT